MHQRVNSNSTRIAIPPSPVQAGPSRAPAKYDRDDKSHIQHRGSRTHLLASTSSASSQLQSLSARKLQPDTATASRSGKSAKSTRQRILLGLLGSLALYILILRNGGLATYFQHAPAEADVQAYPEGVVDRSVMDKLAALDAAMGYKDEDEIEAREADRLPSRYTSNPNSPPPIRAIPNTKKKYVSADENTVITDAEEEENIRQANLIPAKELDAHTCPGQARAGGGCKFLFAAWLGEQETKAQMHLYQLGLLAISLGRILVLPNVSKSRMMSCAQHPFEFYYSADSLENLGIPTISFSAFSDWSAKRAILPSAQIISVANAKPELPKGALEVDSALIADSIPNANKRKLCLEPPRTYLEFGDYSPLAIYPPAAWYKTPEGSEEFGMLLVNTLSSQQVKKRSWRSSSKGQPPSPDVLVFNYEIRYPALTPRLVESLHSDTTSIGPLLPFSHFAYSSVWSDLADQIISNLSPFITIHWRQETLPSSSIAPCAEALVDKLLQMITERFPTVKTVYLATDYPIEDLQNGRDGVTSHSGTFSRLITEEHHTAMQRFLSLFKTKLTTPLGVRLTTLDAEQANLRIPVELQQMLDLPSSARKPKPNQRIRKLDLAEIDPGLLGIIDKKVAMQAQVFMRGLPLINKDYQETACAKESSFTKQISEARKDLIDKGNTKLWNDVEFWSRSMP